MISRMMRGADDASVPVRIKLCLSPSRATFTVKAVIGIDEDVNPTLSGRGNLDWHR
jgi:hypothetical protein